MMMIIVWIRDRKGNLSFMKRATVSSLQFDTSSNRGRHFGVQVAIIGRFRMEVQVMRRP